MSTNKILVPGDRALLGITLGAVINRNTGCLQTLIPSRCEYVPWVMRSENNHRTMGLYRLAPVCLYVQITKKSNNFSTD
jgi:hypothetical protein